MERNTLGNVLMHEHIQCVSNDLKHTFGGEWLNEATLCECAVNVLKEVKEKFEVGIFVDGTSWDLGRNVRLLREVSKRSEVHIVASTGLYFYPSMISWQRSADDLYALFMREIHDGMEGTDIRPGILKCAIDGEGMTEDTKKKLTAIGKVQAKTGLPVYVHCGHRDNMAFDAIDLLCQSGAEPKKLVLGHASRRLEAEYLKRVVSKGVYICIDQSWVGSERDVAKVVYALCKSGYEKQLLFSHDRAMRNDFEAWCCTPEALSVEPNIKRFLYLFVSLFNELKKIGCTEKQCNLFLRENALDVLDV